jgi:predicted RecA/RadA family phage recombinase
MKNFIESGDQPTLAMPYDRTSGQGVKVGTLFGVVTIDALSGVSAPVRMTGVFDITKLSTDVVTAGQALYWDDTNKRLTTTSTSNLFVGHATAAASGSVSIVRCRLSSCPSKAAG